MAGSWAMPSTLALLGAAKAFRLSTRCFVWTEANLASVGHTGGVHGKIRGWVYETADGLVLPGQVAKETVESGLGIEPRRIVFLPNIVDERVFGAGVSAARARRGEIRRMLGASEEDVVVPLCRSPPRTYEGARQLSGRIGTSLAIEPPRGHRR